MLHHLSFAVADLARSGAFYDAALAPLGCVRVWEDESAIGYGFAGGDDKFAIKLRPGKISVPGEGFHVAFAAPSREAVKAFFDAALGHGGKDNGGRGFIPNMAMTTTLPLLLIQTAIVSRRQSFRRATHDHHTNPERKKRTPCNGLKAACSVRMSTPRRRLIRVVRRCSRHA